MNSTELSMYNFLKDLKENHHIIGIKISYEDEGLTGELAQIISSIAFRQAFPFRLILEDVKPNEICTMQKF